VSGRVRLLPSLRPRDRGAPHDAYFQTLDDELRVSGPMRPCLVIDLDRLDHNIDCVTRSIARVPGRRLRIVEKSLPAPDLLRYVARRAGTDRLMSFHAPFLAQDAALFPTFDLLVGKPLPVRAAEGFYRDRESARALRGPFDPSTQLSWLVDTEARTVAYRELARGLGLRLRVSIEIDVGLHRGGVVDARELAAVLRIIAEAPGQLELAGFMGYDPFVAPLPTRFGIQRRAFDGAMARYQAFVDQLRHTFPTLWTPSLIFDAAGSPTYRLHERETLSNDIAVGTGLLKPARYDIPTLADHLPAVFIAAPVLKTLPSLRLPVLERASGLLSAWDPNLRTTSFLYGGNWAADIVSPHGLAKSRIFAPSSNHEGFHASARAGLSPDGHVFFRPHQVEATLLQFGDLIAVRGGRIEATWPVLAG
jgi:D-serine deaminase-like pyridoxal phosphate-dependent protein